MSPWRLPIASASKTSSGVNIALVNEMLLFDRMGSISGNNEVRPLSPSALCPFTRSGLGALHSHRPFYLTWKARNMIFHQAYRAGGGSPPEHSYCGAHVMRSMGAESIKDARVLVLAAG